MKVFVDTNVLLNVIANRAASYEDSASVWTLAECGRIDALVAATSFTDVYCIVRRLANRRKAKTAHIVRPCNSRMTPPGKPGRRHRRIRIRPRLTVMRTLPASSLV